MRRAAFIAPKIGRSLGAIRLAAIPGGRDLQRQAGAE
jgi:hypothetical protein